ncbi:MAG: HK97 family phage prohead protease [Carnobacterium sp.]|jgi:hypothetical protein|uniref:HK97 family phage prohead protease n=1 Tax=Lactobacillales TaxID=186826 RepID=UPI00026C8A5A|nr:HK97 family phage prohead protease [Carnobacterium maltaromaticum]
MKKWQTRSYTSQLSTRAEGESEGEKIIEGYFAVFNSETELWKGAFEEIVPGAFDTLSDDIRGLINHDTAMVLGRTKSGSLTLKVDSKGLYGRIIINENDSDATNLYERVKRGDVDQCSIGFNVIQQKEDFRDDGTIKWTLTEVELHEVSVVTFPAYEDTAVEARKKDYSKFEKKRLDQKKQQLRERLRNGTKTINDK